MKQTKMMYLTMGLMIVTTQGLFASTKSLVTFTNDQDKNKVTLMRFPKKVGQLNWSGYNPNKEYNHEKVQELHRRV